jgi:predicted SnoaL-like aldol condensation-catalyzing enzyme
MCVVKTLVSISIALTLIAAAPSEAEARKTCRLSPKEVVTKFMTKLYIDRKPREAFEAWVDPNYIQHNPMAATGRDAAVAFLEPFMASNPNINYSIKRIIADGNLVAVHAHGRFAPDDRGIAVVDILRVEGCKVMEHWDVVQPVPATSANNNGMF